MAKKNIYFLFGAIVLSIGSIFLAKAKKPYVSFVTAVTSGGIVVVGDFTTIPSHGCAAYFITAGTMMPQTLVTAVNRVKQAYINCH